MSRDLVSVIMPNFNYGRFILEALDSVYAQTHKNIEVIVCDDGSTDDSVQLVREHYPKTKLIRNDHRGVSHSRNSGIARATGTYVAFLDSDDIWHSQKLEFQLIALRRNPGWYYVGCARENDLGQLNHFRHVPEETDFLNLSAINFLTVIPISSSDIMIRRRCFSRIGVFDETLHGAEDKDLWIRLSMEYGGGKVNLPLWKCRTHDHQASRNPDLMNSTRSLVIRRCFRTYPLFCIFHSPRILGHHYYESSIIHRDEGGNTLKAVCNILLSILFAPYTYDQNATLWDRIKFLLVTLRYGSSFGKE